MNYDNKFYEELRYRSYVGLINAIIDYLSNHKEKIFNLRELYWQSAPCDIDEYLEENGWNRDSFDTNGWQQDTWYYYSHKDYPFEIVMEYSGFYGGLKLYRGDIDD